MFWSILQTLLILSLSDHGRVQYISNVLIKKTQNYDRNKRSANKHSWEWWKIFFFFPFTYGMKTGKNPKEQKTNGAEGEKG